MAIKLEELQVLISANADQFKGELLSVKQELQNLNKSTKQATSGLGGQLFGSILKANIATGLLAGGIQRVTRGMSGLIGQIIQGGSAYSRLTIATDTVAQNLGLTREQVQGLRDDLAEANTYGINAENVIRTLALSGLIKMSEGLEAVDARTGKTAKGVTALTLAIKDLAAANAIDSSAGIDRVSRFIQTGNTSFVDGMIELGNLGTEYRMFADSLGKTRAELTQLEEAQARLNIVMREADKVWGAYANTYQTSGKALGSIRDITQSLTQMIGRTFEPVLRVGSNAILQFFVSIRTALRAGEDSIGNFANRVAGYMVALIRLIGRLMMMIPGIGKYFENLANFTVKPIQAAKGVKDAMDDAGNAVADAGKDMDETGSKAKKLAKELAGLAGLDEMDVLKSPTDSGGAGSGAGAGGGITGGDVGGGGGGGLSLDDSSNEIMKYAEEAENAIKNVLSPIKKFLDYLKEITVFGTPLTKILGNIAKYVGIAFLAFKIGIPILKILLSPLAMVFGWFSNLQGLFVLLKPLLMTTVAILGGFTAPLLVVIAAIAALVAVFVYLWQTNEAFRESIMGLINGAFLWIQENLVPVFEQVMDVFKELAAVFIKKIPLLLMALNPLIQSIGTFLVDAFQLLGRIVDFVWKNALKPLVDLILANIVPAFTIAMDVLIVVIAIFAQVASTILDLVIPILNTLWTIFETVFTAVKNIVEFVWKNILKPIFTAVWDIITKLIIPVIRNLMVIWGHVFNAIRSVAESVWNRIKHAIKPVVDWIANNIMPHINRLKDGMENAFNSIKNTATSIWDGIKGVFKSGINGIIDFINGMIRKVNGLIEDVNSVATKIPGVSAIEFRVGEIPRLAVGGVVTSPTLAHIGEGGYKEAVLPLERNTGWAEQVAELINGANSGNDGGAYIVVQMGGETIFEKFVEYTNERSVATSKPILNI